MPRRPMPQLATAGPARNAPDHRMGGDGGPRRPVRCIDTHFHANIYRRSPAFRAQRAQQLADHAGHLDILCSTEHAYKDPVGAYDFLAEAIREQDLDVELVPGVEAITREGVDILFLFPDREALVAFTHDFPAFSWSIHDIAHVETSGIRILPHAFSPSNTGIVSSIGRDRALPLFAEFDYIERVNGSFHDTGVLGEGVLGAMKRIEMTRNFPEDLLPEGVESSIGSDAHVPRAMNVFGVVEDHTPGQGAFEILAQRRPMRFGERPSTPAARLRNIKDGLGISFVEFLQKQAYKTRT